MNLNRILIIIISLAVIAAIVMISIYACGSRSSNLSSLSIPSEGGTINPSEGTYDKDVEVNIRAIPNTGYRFDHWEGSASSTSSTILLTMDGGKHLEAYFTALIPKTVSLINRRNITVFKRIKISIDTFWAYGITNQVLED
jgi:hypothetical protein